VSDINGRVARVLDEVIPTLQGATHTLKEAERALHEAAETIENLHIVSDNIRHKLEVADAVGARVRRLPQVGWWWASQAPAAGYMRIDSSSRRRTTFRRFTSSARSRRFR
jgi:hypothetical protein